MPSDRDTAMLRAVMALRNEPAHPSLGGSEGHDTRHRQDALNAAAAGAVVTPSRRSLLRWTVHGTGRQKKRGNHPKRKLRGKEGLAVVLYRIAYPTCTADQMITFIFKCTGKIYSRKDITDREQELGLTRKVGSTLAFQALTPINLAKRNLFWTTPHPTGIQGTPRAALIDIDEAGAASACHCHVCGSLPPFLLLCLRARVRTPVTVSNL
jgi:hypothetical protein